MLEHRERPLLERFGEERVVRVRARRLRDPPGVVPLHEVLVDEQPHQLRDGNRRVGVVELSGPVRIELVEPLAAAQMQTHHVLQRARDEEVLLRQPQPFAGLGLVVRIQHLGDGFGDHLLFDRTVVVADVERVEVERFGGFRFPQPQQVGRRARGNRAPACRRRRPSRPDREPSGPGGCRVRRCMARCGRRTARRTSSPNGRSPTGSRSEATCRSVRPASRRGSPDRRCRTRSGCRSRSPAR